MGRNRTSLLLTGLLLGVLAFGAAGCRAEEESSERPEQGMEPVPAPGQTMPDGASCGADELQHLLGQPGSVLDAMRFNAPVRIIRPGMAVTMDYRLDRLNIEIDENETIIRLRCG